uniref:Uncharacterized protein n=1 Tax=Alexandrium catenella TaxID=2925 RepID=A0A7S1L7H2_ALECA|mmetsp:Transcript_107710/g.286719  ORF Transcript_107710/g.286719 Transcript_107710/m.286719 type:complete len:266 (+) Transcript_107710:51-848(+)
MVRGSSRVTRPRARTRAAQLLQLSGAALLLLLWTGGQAWSVLPRSPAREVVTGEPAGAAAVAGRRATVGAGLLAILTPGDAARASGGATAGKYSTIPSAKRRFYGRVRQGIYQFLQMEEPIKNGDLENPLVRGFFAKNIIKEKGGEPIPVCMFADCVTKEKRTSRWNDFKVATDLLASAFRYDASDINDNLPQVRLIRAYAKKIEKLKTAILDGDVDKAKSLYKIAKLDLSRYTGMVELKPISSEDYTHEWDTRPQVYCQDNFCV